MGIDPMNNISNNNKNTLCSYIISTGTSRRFPSHMDHELSEGRKEAFRRIYHDRASFDEVEARFIDFSS
jgi:hypothetical protein